MTAERSTLLALALRAFKWNALGLLSRIVLQFAVMIALARLTNPADFGFFGGSLLVYGLAALLADRGLGMALVQRAELDDVLRRCAWARLLVGHGVVALLVWFAAPVLADMLGDAGLAAGIRATVPALLVTALMVMPMMELRRRLDFRRLQMAQLGGYLAGYVFTAIPMAIAGWGGWSLIAALFAQQCVMAAVCIRAAPQPLRPRWAPLPASLGGFGLRVVGSNLANWVTENLDNLLVARLRGLADLGTYSVAYSLARTPTNHVVNLIQQLVFATSARAQGDKESLQRGYLALVKAVGLVTLPVFLGAALVADSVIEGLYGARWLQAGPVFAALCVAMPFHALRAVTGPILAARGRPGVEMKIQIGVAVVLAAVLFVFRDGSLALMAWGVCGVYLLRAIAMIAALTADLGIAPSRVLRALVSPLAVAAVVMLVLALLAGLPGPSGAAARLAGLIGGAGAALALVALCGSPAILGEELAFLLRRFPALERLAVFGRAGG